MIGWASMYRFLAADYDDYSVELRSKWSIETLPDGPQSPLRPALVSL
jgi:N6-L-threonylcarbamoyladenine synthase